MTIGASPPSIVRRTQALDLARAFPLGALTSLETSLLLTIAITRFGAAGPVKGVVAAAAGFGLLGAPVATAFARRLPLRAMTLATVLAVVSAMGYGLAASGPLALFVLGAVIGVAAIQLPLPLLTQMYDENYPISERGRRVGFAMSVKVVAAALGGIVLGAVLSRSIDDWRVVVLVGVVLALLVAASNAFTPSTRLDRVAGRRNRPWPRFDLLRHDPALRIILGAWMVMGFGNLMLLPLRIEYLANAKYGIGADATFITLVTVTVPSITRLALMPLVGVLFDRLEFFRARIAVNLLFILYVAVFFTSDTDVGFVLGVVAFGFASAGGELMWSLWVTKFAPAGRVADYMGLHTFFTGVRAVIAPMFGFVIVSRLALTSVAMIGVTLMLVSSLMLAPSARRAGLRRPTPPGVARDLGT